jgi:hypothetical protein
MKPKIVHATVIDLKVGGAGHEKSCHRSVAKLQND